MLPPRGGHSRPQELPNKGTPDGRAGELRPSEGDLMLPPLRGGEGRNHIAGKWGAGGGGGGIATRASRPMGARDPQVGDRNGSGGRSSGRREDGETPLGRVSRPGMRRTGMVWEPGGVGFKTPWTSLQAIFVTL